MALGYSSPNTGRKHGPMSDEAKARLRATWDRKMAMRASKRERQATPEYRKKHKDGIASAKKRRLAKFQLNGVPLTDIVEVVQIHCRDKEWKQRETARGCHCFLTRVWFREGKPEVRDEFKVSRKRHLIWFGFRAIEPMTAEAVRAVVNEIDWAKYAKRSSGSQVSLRYEDIYQAVSDWLNR